MFSSNCIYRNMKQEQCQIRVNLAISLAVAQIFFLSGITATSNLGVCTFVGVMLHYFYLVAFGWMMLEGVYLYLMVVKVFNTVIKMRLYYMFAWGKWHLHRFYLETLDWFELLLHVQNHHQHRHHQTSSFSFIVLFYCLHLCLTYSFLKNYPKPLQLFNVWVE